MSGFFLILVNLSYGRLVSTETKNELHLIGIMSEVHCPKLSDIIFYLLNSSRDTEERAYEV